MGLLPKRDGLWAYIHCEGFFRARWSAFFCSGGPLVVKTINKLTGQERE